MSTYPIASPPAERPYTYPHTITVEFCRQPNGYTEVVGNVELTDAEAEALHLHLAPPCSDDCCVCYSAGYQARRDYRP